MPGISLTDRNTLTRLATPGRHIRRLWARFGPGTPISLPTKITSHRATLETEFSKWPEFRIQFGFGRVG
jgi:hypothetical protein